MQQSKSLLFVGKAQNSTADPLWYEMEALASDQFAEAHDESVDSNCYETLCYQMDKNHSKL